MAVFVGLCVRYGGQAGLGSVVVDVCAQRLGQFLVFVCVFGIPVWGWPFVFRLSSRFCLVLRVHLALCVVGWWVAPWVVSWFRAAVLAVFQCCFVDVVFFGCFASSFVGCRVGAASGLCQWVFGCVVFPVFDGSRLLEFSQTSLLPSITMVCGHDRVVRNF